MLNNALTECRKIEDFQWWRRKCGDALVLFLTANAYFGVLLVQYKGSFVKMIVEVRVVDESETL